MSGIALSDPLLREKKINNQSFTLTQPLIHTHMQTELDEIKQKHLHSYELKTIEGNIGS